MPTIFVLSKNKEYIHNFSSKNYHFSAVKNRSILRRHVIVMYNNCRFLVSAHKKRGIKTSRKHLRTKVTPDFHLTYNKNGGNLGSESK